MILKYHHNEESDRAKHKHTIEEFFNKTDSLFRARRFSEDDILDALIHKCCRDCNINTIMRVSREEGMSQEDFDSVLEYISNWSPEGYDNVIDFFMHQG